MSSIRIYIFALGVKLSNQDFPPYFLRYDIACDYHLVKNMILKCDSQAGCDMRICIKKKVPLVLNENLALLSRPEQIR